MNGKQILGIALLVIGIMTLFFGYQSSQAVDDRLFEAFTGRFTESTMWLLIVGAVSSVVGLALLFVKK